MLEIESKRGYRQASHALWRRRETKVRLAATVLVFAAVSSSAVLCTQFSETVSDEILSVIRRGAKPWRSTRRFRWAVAI